MTDDGRQTQIQETAPPAAPGAQPASSQPTSPNRVSPIGPATSQPLSMLIQALQSSLHAQAQSDSPDRRPASNPVATVGPAEVSMINTGGLSNSFSTAGSAVTPPSFSGLPSSPKAVNSEPLAANLGANNIPSRYSSPQPTSTLSNLESLAQLQAIARHSSIPEYQVPSLASLLTPADTALLASLLALQQRQYAQQLSNGDLLLSSFRPGASRQVPVPSAASSLYKETGSCRYGNKCQFAHGPNELRPIQRHPKYKTEICRTFAQTGACPYGTRCRFIHYFHRPALNTTAALLGQAGLAGALPHLHSDSSLTSIDSYLSRLGTGSTAHSSLLTSSNGSLEGLLTPASYSPFGQVTNGVYMPPLPPSTDSSLSSGLPSLTPRATTCDVSPAPAAVHRRLPVFKTFTDPPAALSEPAARPTASSAALH